MPEVPSKQPPVLKIADHFASLKDPRVVGRTDHPLSTILVIALVVEMPHGVPSADTFRRVLRALRPQAFLDCVRSWVQSLSVSLNGQVVAFDGKTIRGALERTRRSAKRGRCRRPPWNSLESSGRRCAA